MDSGHWYAGTLQCLVLTTHASFSRPQLDALGIVIAAEKLAAKLRNEVVAETVRMFAMPQRAMEQWHLPSWSHHFPYHYL